MTDAPISPADHDPRRFVCAKCGGRFIKAWSEDEAVAEARQDFGVDDPGAAGFVLVCDDCYRDIQERLKSEAP